METRIIVEVELIKENAKKENEENMLTVFCLFDSKIVLIHDILFTCNSGGLHKWKHYPP